MRRSKPKYILLQHKSPKSNKIYLQSLENDVQKSKIAVENITTFNANQQQFKNKIDDIQNQLQNCITNINVETKRNKALQELIALLKGEMFEYQRTQKKKEQADRIHQQKFTKKITYQLSQICQKHNEQVAKIHQLKEQANGKRSERVVYSNLFKKLEKEIKHYEQIYKEQLVKYETVKMRQDCLTRQRMMSDKQFDNFEQGNEKKQNQDLNRSLNETLIQGWNMMAHYDAQSYDKAQSKKKTPQNEKASQTKVSSSHKQEKRQQTKQILKQITQFTNYIQKIKIHTQCSSVQEILEHFSNLDEQNQQILSKISNQDTKIYNILKEHEKLQKGLAQIQFANRYSINLQEDDAPQTTQIFSKTYNKQNNHEQLTVSRAENIKNMNKQLQAIGQLLGITIRTQQNQQNLPEKRVLKKIDSAIQKLVERKDSKKGDKKNGREDSMASESMVEGLLDKMQRFGNCERILNRQLLQQEYHKEINKRKSTRIKR